MSANQGAGQGRDLHFLPAGMRHLSRTPDRTTHTAQRILIAEDDRTLAETIVYNLKQEGFRTDIARTGLEAVTMMQAQQPDLLLLDIMLPEMDGFEVCRTVRQRRQNMPIIMVTARDDEVDRVLGLELGADDYVVKPFSLRELLARIHAQLRRMEMIGSTNTVDETLVAGELELRPGSRAVFLGDEAVHLLPREFDLLRCLMQNRGIVLSRNQLLEKVWGVDYLGDERTVDVHIRRLRMKIEPEASAPRFIHTVYGVGYTFDVRV